MAFDNQLGKGKDWRKPYYRSKSFDRTCRNHGSCEYCANSRTFNSKRRTPLVFPGEFYASITQLVE